MAELQGHAYPSTFLSETLWNGVQVRVLTIINESFRDQYSIN